VVPLARRTSGPAGLTALLFVRPRAGLPAVLAGFGGWPRGGLIDTPLYGAAVMSRWPRWPCRPAEDRPGRNRRAGAGRPLPGHI